MHSETLPEGDRFRLEEPNVGFFARLANRAVVLARLYTLASASFDVLDDRHCFDVSADFHADGLPGAAPS